MIKKYKKFLKENVGMGSLFFTQYPYQYNTIDNPTDRGKEGNIEYHKTVNRFQSIQNEIKNLLEKDIKKRDKNITEADIEKELRSFFEISDDKKEEIRHISDKCDDIKKCAKEIYNKYKKYSDIKNYQDDVNDQEIVEDIQFEWEEEEEMDLDGKIIELKNLNDNDREKLISFLKKNNVEWKDTGPITIYTGSNYLKYKGQLVIKKRNNGQYYMYFTEDRPGNIELHDLINENILKKNNDFLLESKLNGKYGFFIFLDIIDQLKNSFIKEDYLNTKDFNLFFTTDKIEDKMKLSDILEFKKSLNIAYETLIHIRNLRLSFYFGVKDFKLQYGFHDDLKRMIYKVGEFKITSTFLRNLRSYKCITLISNILENVILKDLNILQKTKKDLVYFIDDKFKDIKFIDEKRLFKCISNKELDNYVKGDKLTEYFDSWCFKHKWYYSVYNYVDRDDNNTYFYIKIKDKDDGLNLFKRNTDIDKLDENMEEDEVLHTDPDSGDQPVITEPMIKEPLESGKLKINKNKKNNKQKKSDNKKEYLLKYYKDLNKVLININKDKNKNKSYLTKHLYKIVNDYDKPFNLVKMDLKWLHNKLKENPDFIEEKEDKNKK